MNQRDSDLASAYVRATEALSQEEAADAIGVSQSTLSNWRKGKLPKKLRPAWRREILGYLDGRVSGNGEGKDGKAPPYNEVREESELAKIGALPDSLLRTMERESIAAVIRAQGMRDACRAARVEAEKAPNRSLPADLSLGRILADLRALAAATPHLPTTPADAEKSNEKLTPLDRRPDEPA